MFKRKLLIYLFATFLPFFAIHATGHAQEYDTVKAIEPPITEDSITVAPADNGKDSYEIKTTKGNFKDINEGSVSITQQRKVADTAMKKLSNDDDFWYVNANNEKPKERNEGFWGWLWRVANYKITKIIVWSVLILLMLTGIVLYLRENQIGLFASSSRKIKNDDTGNESMPENIFEIDYDIAINKALADNNFRLATRFLFLRALKTLSSKNIIDYAADKTNFDYLFQISGTKYYAQFVNAAKHYEYLWYGNFEVNDEQFNVIKNGFDNFQKQLA